MAGLGAGDFQPPRGELLRSPRDNVVLPDLGPDQFFVHFVPHGRGAHPRFLAEPVWRNPLGTPPPEQRAPVVTVLESGHQLGWFPSPDGSVNPPALAAQQFGRTTYRQVVLPAAEPGVSQPVRASEPYREHLCNHTAVPALRDWTTALVRRLVAGG